MTIGSLKQRSGLGLVPIYESSTIPLADDITTATSGPVLILNVYANIRETGNTNHQKVSTTGDAFNILIFLLFLTFDNYFYSKIKLTVSRLGSLESLPYNSCNK